MWVNNFFKPLQTCWRSGPVLTFHGPGLKYYVPSSKNNVLVPNKFAKNVYNYLFKTSRVLVNTVVLNLKHVFLNHK